MFSSASRPRANSRVESLAKLVAKDLKPSARLGEVIKAVWSNDVVTSQCPDLVIRLTTLRGSVSQHIWQEFGHDPNEVSSQRLLLFGEGRVPRKFMQIQLMAVGSTDHPLHLPNYVGFLRNFYDRTSKLTAGYPDTQEFDVGYDLLSTGSSPVRSSMLELFNEHYQAPDAIVSAWKESSAMTCGGMRGLKDLADAQVLAAAKAGTFVRFVQPDNSFGTWWNIVESPAVRHLDRRQLVTIGTSQANKLHVSVDDVDQFYKVFFFFFCFLVEKLFTRKEGSFSSFS